MSVSGSLRAALHAAAEGLKEDGLVQAMRTAGFAHHRRVGRHRVGDLLVVHFPVRDVGLSRRVDLILSDNSVELE